MIWESVVNNKTSACIFKAPYKKKVNPRCLMLRITNVISRENRSKRALCINGTLPPFAVPHVGLHRRQKHFAEHLEQAWPLCARGRARGTVWNSRDTSRTASRENIIFLTPSYLLPWRKESDSRSAWFSKRASSLPKLPLSSPGPEDRAR